MNLSVLICLSEMTEIDFYTNKSTYFKLNIYFNIMGYNVLTNYNSVMHISVNCH